MKTEHNHGKCETCKHWVSEYAPYIKRVVMTCDLPSRNAHCKGDYEYEAKEEKDGNSRNTKKD